MSVLAKGAKRSPIAIIVLLLAGLALIWGGAQLLLLNGSAYYLISGFALVAAAILLFCGRREGYWVYAAFVAATAIWAFYEVGSDFWGQFARMAAPITVGLGLVLGIGARRYGALKVYGAAAVIIVILASIGYFSAGRSPSGLEPAPVARAQPATDWPTYAGDLAASRHATPDQITPANVSRLLPLWTYRTGDMPWPADALTAWTFEVTPLKVGNRLFLCTAHSQVHAIDADTGRRLWVYDPVAKLDWIPLRACRGLAYYKLPAASGAVPNRICAERIFSPVVDGRLAAIDAATGRVCPEFGVDGLIDLRDGLGPVRPGYYHSTSGPLVVGDRIIVGANIMDGAEIGEPSGVIRAFDARTGRLDWAWDLGAADGHGGGAFTRGTPNAWAPLTADPGLGLVYVPLGNPTPDFFGAYRTPAMERFGSALVALDAATGTLRWVFQTTHHDLWDQDIPAQPSLFDMRTAKGVIPALVQPTKRGELFVLDRRNGKPIVEVAERPAPRGAAEGDFSSPTQPYSVGMPSLLPPRLHEEATWGITPLDQLACRIRFRQLRYEGPLTPPSVRGSLSYPGSAGIISWGGVSIDPGRHLLVVNSVHSPFVTRLIPRAEAIRMGLSSPPNSRGASAASKGSAERASGAMAGLPQVGTPYAAQAQPFLSPLGIPCIAPPWGRLTAIDLETRHIAWQMPFGTSRDTGPLGLRVGLPLPIGVPSAGGPVTTRSGLLFIAAAQDRYIRAFATISGIELWRARLPAGGQATPMTYVSGRTGRQILVVAAGGHGGLNTAPGDYVEAFALGAVSKD